MSFGLGKENNIHTLYGSFGNVPVTQPLAAMGKITYQTTREGQRPAKKYKSLVQFLKCRCSHKVNKPKSFMITTSQ